MTARENVSSLPSIACRFAVWMLPPHRKEWGEAMLNEVFYIKSHRSALQWASGCALTAFRERVAFELGRTFMTRRIFKVAAGLGAVLIIIGVGTYIDLKPYQRERVWISVREEIHPGDSKRVARNRITPASTDEHR